MKTMREIEISNNRFTFIWAVTQLLEMGTEAAKEITDEQIECQYECELEAQKRLRENGSTKMYTAEVVRDMLIATREMAQIEPVDFINYFVTRELFEINERPISYGRMTEICGAAIQNLDEYAKEDFISDCYLEPEEAEWLGVEMEEEE